MILRTQLETLRQMGDSLEFVSQTVVSLCSEIEGAGFIGLLFKHLIADHPFGGIITKFTIGLRQKKGHIDIFGIRFMYLPQKGECLVELSHPKIHFSQEAHRLQVMLEVKGSFEAFFSIRKFTHLHGTHTVIAQGIEFVGFGNFMISEY